jgi:hypothetical protein
MKKANIAEHDKEEFHADVASKIGSKSVNRCFNSKTSKHMTNKSDWSVEYVEDKANS